MECHHRALGLARPIFNRARTLTATAVGLFLILFLANMWVRLAYNPGSDVVNRSGSAIAQADLFEPSPRSVQPHESAPPKSDSEAKPEPLKHGPLQPEAVEKNNDSLVSGDSGFEEPEKNPVSPVMASVETEGASVSGSMVELPKKVASTENPASRAGIISTLEVVSEEGGLTVEIRGQGSFENIKSYFLTNPNRFSIHVKGKWNARAVRQLVYPVNTASIKQIRLGKHRDHFRLVFDLVKDRKVTPKFNSERGGLSIFFPQP